MIRFLGVLVFFLACSVQGEEFCGDSKAIQVYFGNGMFNSQEAATESMLALENRLKAHLSKRPSDTQLSGPLELAYNTNEWALDQIMQVSHQKEAEGRIQTWKYLAKQEWAPEWFKRAMLRAAANIELEQMILDQDLKEQVQSYKAAIKREESVVIVAHSQGNLYANFSLDILRQKDSKIFDKIKIVAVATPAKYVAGNGKYSTLSSDGVINAVRTQFEVLPANVDNSKQGELDHAFVEHYLNGDVTGPKILKETVTAFGKGKAFLHVSLKPVQRWAMTVKHQKTPLRPAQCLALSALALNYGHWGIECSERNLQASIDWLDLCLARYWVKKNRWDFGYCYVYDVTSVIWWNRAPFLESVFVDRHPECRWDNKKLLSTITPALVEEAKSVLRNPPR